MPKKTVTKKGDDQNKIVPITGKVPKWMGDKVRETTTQEPIYTISRIIFDALELWFEEKEKKEALK